MDMAGKQKGQGARGAMKMARHFSLLGAMVTGLAATGAWRPTFGAIVWFGIYGALHSSAVVLTWRGRQPPWRALIFVGVAASLSMLCAELSLFAVRHCASLSAMGPALPLALSSGLGALAYALWFQWLGARLPRRAYFFLPVVCIVATVGVLATGAYQYGGSHGGSLWFASAWWLAFSAGLKIFTLHTARNPLI
jgi:hypothetical protein